MKGVGILISERLVGLWFMQLDERSDYMGALESLPEGGFRFKYRFRYNDPDPSAPQDPFSPKNKDVKHWYEVKCPSSKGESLAAVHVIIRLLEEKSGHRCTELMMRNGDVNAFMREFAAQPWANMKTEPRSANNG